MQEQQTASAQVSAKFRLTPGFVLDDRLEIISPLGAGGMSVVYLARQLQFDRQVALKMMQEKFLGNSEAVQRFHREAMAVAGLDHPNIVKLIQFGIWQDQPYMAMEVVEGITLADVLQRDTRISTEKCQQIFSQVLDGLAYAHGKGIVHRDLKPSNIMLVAGEQEVKIVDFGIAKLLPQSGFKVETLTATDRVFGTVQYMSPEQCSGSRNSVDASSDLYSLGCVMYEALTGKPPFVAENAYSIVAKQMGEQPLPSAHLDKLSDVVLSLLQKDPKDRPPNALAVKDALLEPATFKGPVPVKQFRLRKPNSVALISVSALLSGVLMFCLLRSLIHKPPSLPAAVLPGQKPVVSIVDSADFNKAQLDVTILNRPETAAAGFSKCLTDARRKKDIAGQRACLSQLENCYWVLGDSRRTVEAGAELLQLPEPTYRSEDYSQALSRLSVFLRRLGRAPESLLVAQKAFDYTRRVQSSLGDRMETTFNVACSMEDTGNLDEAIKYFQAVLDLDPTDREKPFFSQSAALKVADDICKKHHNLYDLSPKERQAAREALTRAINCTGEDLGMQVAQKRAKELLARLPR